MHANCFKGGGGIYRGGLDFFQGPQRSGGEGGLVRGPPQATAVEVFF